MSVQYLIIHIYRDGSRNRYVVTGWDEVQKHFATESDPIRGTLIQVEEL